MTKLYASSVIRRKRGAMGQELKVDLTLPHNAKLGIVVVSATPDAIKYEYLAEDGWQDTTEDELPWFSRAWGHLGGAIYPCDARGFATREEAVEDARMRMLSDGWHETREAAIAAGIEEFRNDPRRIKKQAERQTENENA